MGSGAFGRWLCHEGTALMKGISTFINEAGESFLAPFCHVRTQEKMSMRKLASPNTESAALIDLAINALSVKE